MKGEVIAFISAPGVGTSFLTRQMACRNAAPGFFEGEEGIFPTSVLETLNGEEDTPNRHEFLSSRTKKILERAHAIANIGITSYVDGDILLMEAWLEAEIGDKSPKVLGRWIQDSKHLMADKVIVLTASDKKIQDNIILRGRASEQTDFIKQRALRIGRACINLEKKYTHVAVLDRTNLEFTDIKTLEMVDKIIGKIKPLRP